MQPHEEWLFKAQHDLDSARLLASEAHQLLDVAAYHCQQCAEKSLKAFLVYKNQTVNKTHDIGILVQQCSGFLPEFSTLMDAAIFLSPLATAYRYPEGDLMPDQSEVNQALIYSEIIYDFVITSIERDSHPLIKSSS